MRRWSWCPCIALFVVASLNEAHGASAEASPATAPVAKQRWAVVASGTIASTPLPDLLVAELSSLPNIAFAEREQIRKIANEQALSAAFGNDATVGRLRLGRLLRADVLVLLSDQRRGNVQIVQAVISDTASGARLAAAEFTLGVGNFDQTIASLVELSARTHARFSQGVRTIIAVTPLLSKNADPANDRYIAEFSRMIGSGFDGMAGVAVLEISEARAIAAEQALTGAGDANARDRLVQLIVEGDYQILPVMPQAIPGQPPPRDPVPGTRVNLRLTSGGQILKRIDARVLELKYAPQFFQRELRDQMLTVSAATRAPVAVEEQFRMLTQRASVFAKASIPDEAASLREAALLLKPDAIDQRKAVIQNLTTYIHSKAGRPEKGEFHAAKWQAYAAPRVAAWERAVDHLEVVLRSPGTSLREACQLASVLKSSPVPADARSSMAAAHEQCRQRLFRTLRESWPLALTFSDDGKMYSSSGFASVGVPSPRDAWVDVLMSGILGWDSGRLVDQVTARGRAFDPRTGRVQLPSSHAEPADLRFLQDVLERVVPDRLPLSNRLVEFLAHGQAAVSGPKDPGTEAALETTLQALARSAKQDCQVYGRYGLLKLKLSRKAINDVDAKAEATAILKLIDATPGGWMRGFYVYKDLIPLASDNRLQLPEHHPQVALRTLAGQTGWEAAEADQQQMEQKQQRSKELTAARIAAKNAAATQPTPPAANTPAVAAAQPTTRATNTPAVAAASLELKLLQPHVVRTAEGDLIQGSPPRTGPRDLAKYTDKLIRSDIVPTSVGLDVYWNRQSVGIMRRPGVLEELFVIKQWGQSHVTNVAWDGKYIWVLVNGVLDGIYLIDPVTGAQQLLGAESGLPQGPEMVHPIKPGQALVSGHERKQQFGWIALAGFANNDPSSRPGVNVFHQARRSGKTSRELLNDVNLVFYPKWIVEELRPDSAGGVKRSFLVGRGTSIGVGHPLYPLRISLDSLRVELARPLIPPGEKETTYTAPWNEIRAVCPLPNATFLLARADGSLQLAARPGQNLPDSTTPHQTLLKAQSSSACFVKSPSGAIYFVPSRSKIYRVNADRSIAEIAVGIEPDGAALSVHYGLVLRNSASYTQILSEPAPKGAVATANPTNGGTTRPAGVATPPSPKPAAPITPIVAAPSGDAPFVAKFSRRTTGEIDVRYGNSARGVSVTIREKNGERVPQTSITGAGKQVPPAIAGLAKLASQIVNPSRPDPKRVTQAQAEKIHAYLKTTPNPFGDKTFNPRFLELYAAFEKTAEGPEKIAAEAALLAHMKSLIDRVDANDADFVKRGEQLIKTVLTPAQAAESERLATSANGR